MFFCITAFASPDITVISPKLSSSGTATGGSPVFYEAYATSADCSNGIASMRIYSAPNVSAFRTVGGHIETFLKLAPGNYNTVVQAWDNCGGVSKTTVPLAVSNSVGITVYLPSGNSDNSPVHIAASAQNSSCSKGISSFRIYTAPNVSPYVVHSNQLDAYVTLPPQSYNLVIQSWDGCGQIFKSPVTIAVSNETDGYLYSSYGDDNAAAQLNVETDGSLSNANGTADPPQVKVSAAFSFVSDPGGWFVYASGSNGISAFQVNSIDGSLTTVSGSPFAEDESATLIMDPSGNFLYSLTSVIKTYRIDRSSGALTQTNTSVSLPSTGALFTTSGRYLYLLTSSSPQKLVGYQLNADNGALKTIAGSPYGTPFSDLVDTAAISATNKYLFAAGDINSDGQITGEIFTYAIDPNTGALSIVQNSPILAPRAGFETLDLMTDWQNKFVWASWQDANSPDNEVSAYAIQSDGALSPTGFAASAPYPGAFNYFTESFSGTHAFTFWTDDSGQQEGVASWDVNAGDLTLTSHIALPQAFPSFFSLAMRQNEALVRKHPN